MWKMKSKILTKLKGWWRILGQELRTIRNFTGTKSSEKLYHVFLDDPFQDKFWRTNKMEYLDLTEPEEEPQQEVWDYDWGFSELSF